MAKQIGKLKALGIKVKLNPNLDKLGEWNEKTGVITLKDKPETVGGAIISIHESLHVAETLLIQKGLINKRVGEKYVESAAPIVLYTLASLGILKNITPLQIEKFMSK